MLMSDPFEALFQLQRALDSYQQSNWLEPNTSSVGPYPSLNVFRKGDDFVVVAEVPGMKTSDLDVQVKNRSVRLAGSKHLKYPEDASFHRRERLAGDFDRTITLPVEIDPDGVKAEYREGVLALFLPRAERDRPKSIKIN